MLSPCNNDVTKLRVLNTFLDGLAELGVDKGLIKNIKLLGDLIENEKRNKASEMQTILPITGVIIRRVHWILKMRRGKMRRRRRKWPLRIVLKLTPKRATTTLKMTTVQGNRK